MTVQIIYQRWSARYQCDVVGYTGLSTDEKPNILTPGSRFWETDTGHIKNSGPNGWYDPPSAGGPMTAASLSTLLHALETKATPVDADEWSYWDSITSTLKKLSWANLKATLKTYFDSLYELITGAYVVGKSAGCSTLAAAIATIGATPATLILPPGNHVGGGEAAPVTLNLKIRKGALITVANGATFTIGPFEAGDYPIFSLTGTGTVVGTSSPVLAVKPVWFGAAGDGVTDDALPLAAAAAFAKTTLHKELNLGTLTYKSTAALDFTTLGIQGTPIITTSVAGVGATIGNCNTKKINLRVNRAAKDWTAGNVGIKCKAMYYCTGYLAADYSETGILWNEGPIGNSMENDIYLGSVRHNKVGLNILHNVVGLFTHANRWYGGHFYTDLAGAECPIKMNMVAPGNKPVAYHHFISPEFGYQVSGAINGIVFDGAYLNKVSAAYLESNALRTNFTFANNSDNNIISLLSYDYAPQVSYADDGCNGNILHMEGESAILLNPHSSNYMTAYNDGTSVHFPGMAVIGHLTSPGTVSRVLPVAALTGQKDDGIVVIDATRGVGFIVKFNVNSTSVWNRLHIKGSATVGLGIRCYDSFGNLLSGAGGTAYAQGRGVAWSASHSAFYAYISPADQINFHPDVSLVQIYQTNGTLQRQFLVSAYNTALGRLIPGYTGVQEMPGRYFAPNAPTKWHFQVGEQFFDESPASGAAMGWTCIKRVDTTVTEDVDAAEVEITVADGSATADGDLIGVKLDTGYYHFTTIASGGGTETLTLTAGPPGAGKVATSGNAIVVNLFAAMANIA